MRPTPVWGLPRAYLRPCLLLLLSEGPSHGYELLEALRTLGLDSAEAGGMYRSLRAMDEEGVVRSWWEPSDSGPARRNYAITPEGTQVLQHLLQEIEWVRSLLGRFLVRTRLALGIPAS